MEINLTLAQLQRDGKLVEVRCLACNMVKLSTARRYKPKAHHEVAMIQQWYVCPHCDDHNTEFSQPI